VTEVQVRYDFPPCPRCGSINAVEIVYGLPDVELGMAAERGEVVLGGCIVRDESPDYQCRACDSPLPWVRPDDPSEGLRETMRLCDDEPVLYAV
jgi:hypothetical protein